MKEIILNPILSQVNINKWINNSNSNNKYINILFIYLCILVIRDERMNKSIGYIIQDNRVLPNTQQKPISPPISSLVFSPQQQQAFYPPPSTTWNQNSPTIPTNNNNSNISSSSSSASQDPSFYGNQPFHLLSPTTHHHPSPYPQNNNYPYQQQQSPPLDYNHPLPFNNHHHPDLMDPLSPAQQEPFYWNTPKLSSQQLSSPTSSSNLNDHWVIPNQYPPQYPYPPPPNFHYSNHYHDNTYYPSSPTYHPSEQQYNHYPSPSSGRQPAFRLIQRPN